MNNHEPGLYFDIPQEKYFAHDAASNSTLSRMEPTPAHCLEYMNNPPKASEAMTFGSLVHALVFEPHLVNERYARRPEGINRRTKAGKAQWTQFESEAAGREIVTHWDYMNAQTLASKVKNHPSLKPLLANGKPEVVALWNDNGRPCKCRIDFVTNDDVIVDLKTTIDASEYGFAKSIAKYGYYRQEAMYRDGYEAATGRKPKRFIFVAVETKKPYGIAIYELDEISVQVGREEYQQRLAKFFECRALNAWPGYSQSVSEISLPLWKLAEHDNSVVEEIY